MIEEIRVITYQSANAKPDERWIGYVVLPNGSTWQVRFSGAEENMVIANAKATYLADKAKQARIYGNQDDEPAEHPFNQPIKSSSDGRGHHFTGKVWVINRITHDLKRIDPSELASYEAKGYERGGPRSK